jgi:hypothetical protein
LQVTRDLDDRQEGLRRIDTHRTKPGSFWMESAPQRPGRFERFWLRLKSILSTFPHRDPR